MPVITNNQTQMHNRQNQAINKISIVILTILFTISCSKKDNDYILLNKVIDLYAVVDKPFYLKENGNFPKTCLKDYYIYKYDKKSYNNIFKESEKNMLKLVTEGEIDEKYIKYTSIWYKHKNCINDSIFNKKELVYLSKQEKTNTWKQEKIISKNKIIVIPEKRTKIVTPKKRTKNIFFKSSYISKPLYNKSGKFAIIRYYENYDKKLNNSKILTFMKVNNNWELIDIMKTHE